MKVFLMYRNRDFDPKEALPWNTPDLKQDLEMEKLFSAMAAGDKFLHEVANAAVLASLRDPDEIRYRQHILADCLERPGIVRQTYRIAVDAIEAERTVWDVIFAKYPQGLLHRSLEVLELFIGFFKKLRLIADEHAFRFRSEGFTRLFSMLVRELDDNYLSAVEEHLIRLAFRHGVLISAELGKGNKGIDYTIRKPLHTERNWADRVQSWMTQIATRSHSEYVYEVGDRDESGLRALSELKGEGISHVAAALGQSTDHILGFFTALRWELGFYVSCLNLRDQLDRKGEPICFPDPYPIGKDRLSARALYDVCLSLSLQDRVIGNDIEADSKLLVMITGANRGGKSTLLRSIGLAQLMMQCGMFVPAESFGANICEGVFTHFKREEDAGMKSGKFDEELSRMSAVVDQIRPRSVVLLNESFASTNEREGSQIADQIIRALLASGIKVLYVTHLFDLAHRLYLAQIENALFLRAERLADGQRTFRVIEGEPLPTSYGEDLYRRIFQKSAVC